MVDKREHTMNTAILLRQSLWDREDKRNWYIDGCNCDQTANDANDEEEEEKEEESSTSSSPNRRVTVIKKINFSNHDPDKYFCTSTFFSEKFKVPSTDKRVSMMDRYMNNYTATQYILLHIRLCSTIMKIYEFTNIGIHRIYECANIRIHKIYEYVNLRIHRIYEYTNPKYTLPHTYLYCISLSCIALQ